MASQNIARLGVVLAMDTAEFTASVDKAISANAKMKNAIKRESNAAEAEIIRLTHATEDYGKVLTQVQLTEREINSGRYMNASEKHKAQLRETAKAYDLITTSAKGAAGAQFKMNEQQKLNLTYQTTDLFTQIASGQSPFIALLQQGGQLKDSMGGLGNMFKALGSFITPASVGLTVFAAAVGAVGYAAYEANQEFDKFQESLTLTGNYAGLTATQLVSMSRSISEAAGTAVGDATSALDALVASGKYTSTSIEAVTKAVLTYSKVAGVDGKQAAEALMSGLDGSASGAKSLNEKMNFLTLAQYKQIEALEKAGKKQEAAKLAADILSQRLEAQKRILGDYELAWEKATIAMSKFWASLKESISGPSTTTGILEKVKGEIEAIEFSLSKSTSPEKYTKAERERLEILKQRRAELEKIIETAKKSEVPPDQKPGIAEYDKYKGMLSGKAAEVEKAKIDAAFKYAQIGANEIEKLELESAKKIVDAYDEMRQKNQQEDGRATAQNLEIYKSKVIAAESELAEKKRQINSKDKIALNKAQVEEEQRLKNMNDDYAKMVANAEWETREKTRTMELGKEELELKYQLIYATEKELKLAELALKYQRLREEAKGKAGSDVILENLDKQEALEKFTVEMQESMQKTQQVFDTVWGNMSAAIDNFVKTGKFSVKDFTRSVIQDMLAMEMKIQAMQLVRGLIGSMFGAFAGVGVGSVGNAATMKPGGGYFADGGDPPVGKVSVVGERGPELFVPKTAGTIIPNHLLGGSGGTTNVTNNYINAIDAKSFEERLLGSSNAIWAANQYANKNLATSFGRT